MCDDGTGLTALYLHYTGTAGVLVQCDKDKINLRCDSLKLIFFLLWLTSFSYNSPLHMDPSV